MILAGWAVHQRRVAFPLVNLATLRSSAVATAQAAGLISGIGMYLLLSLVVRYVQTPSTTGYGLGRSVVASGLILVPFSITSLVVNRLVSRAPSRPDAAWAMPFGCAAFIASMVLFATARTEIWEIVVVMALAGAGVGVIFAALPRRIVDAVPRRETGSTLGFNQVLRTVGSSIGSAISATVLVVYTPLGSSYPTDAGYTVAALVGLSAWVIMAAILLFRRPSTATMDDADAPIRRSTHRRPNRRQGAASPPG